MNQVLDWRSICHCHSKLDVVPTVVLHGWTLAIFMWHNFISLSLICEQCRVHVRLIAISGALAELAIRRWYTVPKACLS